MATPVFVDGATEGYKDGLAGRDPQEKSQYFSCASGSEYEAGYLFGMVDREAGLSCPKYLGYCPELPFQRGMEVTIPKGTPIHHRGKVKPAGRTYKVKVHNVDQGSIMCLASSSWSGERYTWSNPKRPTTPKICFAGSAGYWSEIDINDLVQENPLTRM